MVGDAAAKNGNIYYISIPGQYRNAGTGGPRTVSPGRMVSLFRCGLQRNYFRGSDFPGKTKKPVATIRVIHVKRVFSIRATRDGGPVVTGWNFKGGCDITGRQETQVYQAKAT